MDIIDIHTHRVYKAGIINSSPSAFSPENKYAYSVGIHPWSLEEDYSKEWERLQEIAIHPQVLAIGEAGLDKLTEADMKIQEEVFRLQIRLSEEIGKPLIIHSVRTSNEIIEIKKEFKPRVLWIIHGFRGNKNITSQLLDEGFYLSFGEKYQDESIIKVPLERMFIETDESDEDIKQIYSKIANTLSMPEKQLYNQMRQNIKEVFFT